MMRLVFFGTPEFAVLSLMALLNSEHEVMAAITRPDRQKGRGRRLTYSPVKLEAQRKGLRIFQPEKVREAAFIQELKEVNPSVIVVVAYGQILPSGIISLPEYGCINVHASLLPKYRGAAPVNWAIIHGEKKTGITTMLMDEGMDTGHILLQQEEEIKEQDTAESLSRRLSEIGAAALLQTLKELEEGSLHSRPQTGDVSYAPILKKTDGRINWLHSSKKIYNFIRGMNPWPGAYSFIHGERVKILKTVSVDKSGEAGVIKTADRDELLVGTGRGILSILEIQPAGKQVMSGSAFIRGRNIKEGMKFHEKPVD